MNNAYASAASKADGGADGREISAHVGARPSHAVYQGRQYPNSQYETIVKPLIEDYNCRHSAYPIIMGVTKPSYTEEQLQALDPPPFAYEGKQYTAYKAQQQMRKMERAMRKQKDHCIVADAAGDKDAFTAASIKLRRQKDIYEDLCKAAGTYTEYERTFVAGYNRKLAAKTGAVTRAQNKFKNAQITLTNSENGAIIESEHKVVGSFEKNVFEKDTIMKLSSIFVNSSDSLYLNSQKIKPLEGYSDIVMHGTPSALIASGNNGEEWRYNAHEAAELIKNSREFSQNPDRPIRLISCNTGQGEDCIAQQISDILRVNVLAPTEAVYVNENGEMLITDNDSLAILWDMGVNVKDTGSWVTFKPRKG